MNQASILGTAHYQFWINKDGKFKVGQPNV
jgi:hypothetical protein